MSKIYLKKSNKVTKIYISEEVFVSLYKSSTRSLTKKINDIYDEALLSKTISFINLKKISAECEIPYPLAFGSIDIVNFQITEEKRLIESQLPAKSTISWSGRGLVSYYDIKTIIKDLSKRQRLLSKIDKTSSDNLYPGSIFHDFISTMSAEEIAKKIMSYFDIKIDMIRHKTTEKALTYLIEKVESKNILVSQSSHNFMPRNIPKHVSLSGFTLKDKKFPIIFINSRDGDQEPLILETPARQVFTLLSLLVLMGADQYYFLNSKKQNKKQENKRAYAIVGEILLPKRDLNQLEINGLTDISNYSKKLKVSKSMLLFRLGECGLLTPFQVSNLRAEMISRGSKSQGGRSPAPEKGFLKYNGKTYSTKIIAGGKAGIIQPYEVSRALFKKSKSSQNLLSKYEQIIN